MNHINYNKNERYDKNYNYVQNKINQISKNNQLEYKDILENFLDNSFTQSIKYDFNNNDRTLIKQNINTSMEQTPINTTTTTLKHKDKNNTLYNNTNSIYNKNYNTKTSIQNYSTEEFQLFNNNYECYNLDLSLQNNFCASILFVLSDMFRIFNLKEQINYIKTLKYKMYIELSEKNL